MISDPDICSDPESSSTTVGVYINPGSSMASEKGAILKFRFLVHQHYMVFDYIYMQSNNVITVSLGIIAI